MAKKERIGTMTEIMIRVADLEELTGALNNLARAITGMPVMPQMGTAVTGFTQQGQPVQTFPGAPATAPGPVPTAPPAQPVPSAPPTQQPLIPTTHVGQAYTQEQLAVAMTGLVDAGKVPAIQGILQMFGIQALTQLAPERYPEMAVKLREAGASI